MMLSIEAFVHHSSHMSYIYVHTCTVCNKFNAQLTFSEILFSSSLMLYFVTDSFCCRNSYYDSSKSPKYYKTVRLICDGSLGSAPE